VPSFRILNLVNSNRCAKEERRNKKAGKAFIIKVQYFFGLKLQVAGRDTSPILGPGGPGMGLN